MPVRRLALLLVSVFTMNASGQIRSEETGPYTVSEISRNVFHIEDGNASNPPGVVMGDDGQMVSMNNCSDMYLVVGKEKGLLIDLSNKIEWDSTADESLRSIVFERIEGRKLYITVTHNHGDHLGMLPVFADDPEASFWVPGNEFKATGIFPEERTIYFPENASLDLGGGYILNTLEVPGHTAHSTIYFLEGKYLVFTGDAIGSGSGVWLFNEESFYTYMNAVDDLIAYIEDEANQINSEKLRIYGGHYWQGREIGDLTSRYIYDMQTLIEVMKKGKAEMEDYSVFIPFLNANFRYGTATITWNKEAARKLAASFSGE
jgi:glyoxylase-like metal-dependent hydrolase (beta-lactamase superfamily II)